MPYYHVECGGEIGFWTRKCHKCNKIWPLKVLFMLRYPKDMVFRRLQKKVIRRGSTSYAKWADSAPPGVGDVASRLPNWPRWARILSLVVLIMLIISVVLLIRR